MAETTAPAPIVYHWIITGLLPNGNHITLNGDVDIRHPATRSDLFGWVRGKVTEECGFENVVVLFFSAEPNNIPAPMPAVQPLSLAGGSGGAK